MVIATPCLLVFLEITPRHRFASEKVGRIFGRAAGPIVGFLHRDFVVAVGVFAVLGLNYAGESLVGSALVSCPSSRDGLVVAEDFSARVVPIRIDDPAIGVLADGGIALGVGTGLTICDVLLGAVGSIEPVLLHQIVVVLRVLFERTVLVIEGLVALAATLGAVQALLVAIEIVPLVLDPSGKRAASSAGEGCGAARAWFLVSDRSQSMTEARHEISEGSRPINARGGLAPLRRRADVHRIAGRRRAVHLHVVERHTVARRTVDGDFPTSRIHCRRL